MSDSAINKVLSNAYGKLAKKLGRKFEVYRPVMLNDALSDGNYVKDQHAAFTVSSSFTNTPGEGYRPFICYTDRTDVQIGDIFHDDKETFVIVWIRAIEDMVAIQANQLVKVERATWDNTNGLQAVASVIARNVPASVIGTTSAATNRITNIDQSGQSHRWEVRILAKKADIIPQDNIRLADGTLLRVDQVTLTELFQELVCTEVKE